MDATNQKIEISSSKIKSWIDSNLASLGITEATYLHINTLDKTIHAWPSHYEWFLSYWDKNLDLQLSQRLQKNSQTWSELSYKHQQELYRQFNHVHKTDISIYHNGIYEILSVQSNHDINSELHVVLRQALHVLSHQASIERKRRNADKLLMPLRDAGVLDIQRQQSFPPQFSLLEKNKNFAIQGTRFTGLELETIRHLMLLKTYKEIAFDYKCSETAIRKRITNIKYKLGNPYMPTSQMARKLQALNVLPLCSPLM